VAKIATRQHHVRQFTQSEVPNTYRACAPKSRALHTSPKNHQATLDERPMDLRMPIIHDNSIQLYSDVANNYVQA